MSDRIISISAAPYDGYAFPATLDSIASCGAQYVEPAFIVGYTEPFDESSFRLSKVPQYINWLKQSGIKCYAFSAHLDLGKSDSDTVFARRMDFARALGAKVINTNAANLTNAEGFFRNIRVLAAHAERLDMIIGLENPGNGEDNLFNLALDGLTLLERINSSHVQLNYDAGNTVSHRPGQADPAKDALVAMPGCGHIHLKDVQARADGYYFVPIGQGDVDCASILQGLKSRPDLNLAIEVPLRFHRDFTAQPRRNGTPVEIFKIESTLRQSLDFVRQQLTSKTEDPLNYSCPDDQCRGFG
jgi:sugar phosphate isomerase/epimerase